MATNFVIYIFLFYISQAAAFIQIGAAGGWRFGSGGINGTSDTTRSVFSDASRPALAQLFIIVSFTGSNPLSSVSDYTVTRPLKQRYFG